jgi:hypothetical protein
MGYTHYWERLKVLPRPQFLEAVEDCRRLCAALKIPLGDADGKGSPRFSQRQVCFNGHVDSGKLCSVQRVEGLVWPRHGAGGVALAANAIVGGWGAGPAVTARLLGPEGNGSYETFAVERMRTPRYPREQPASGWWFNFCKTNYRPYDLCVQGCLIILNHRLGSRMFRVDSDGASEHWDDARHASQRVLGYGEDWGEGKLAPPPSRGTSATP